MGDFTISFPPPQNWQDFEKFLKGVVDVIWKEEGWQLYGRPGQLQSGIDLFGYDDSKRFTAIQSKKTNQIDAEGKFLTSSLLTEKIINEEISSAEKIDHPKLQRLIFATTSLRDTNVQDIIRKINDDRKRNGKFIIDIWFWEDFQVLIENHKDLMYFYYSETLKKIDKYDKDIHILSMLRKAFTRPAFSREIRREESGADFIKAIKATGEAITTGRLYNRRDELITTSFDFQILSRTDWKSILKEILLNLNEIRNIYQDGVAKKSIREHETCLEVLDDRIREKFNKLRADCLIKMNLILNDVKLDLIESELIRI